MPFLDQSDFKTGAIYRHINNNFFNKYVYKQRTNALKTKDSFYTPKVKLVLKKYLRV